MQAKQFRILVVDDHELIRRGVCGLFRQDPAFDVCGEATNGKEGVEQAQKLKPDAVILDISMPVMNGFDAAEQIRALVPSAKIVILTMYDATEAREKARKAGADAYVLKSDIAEALLENVKLALGIRARTA